MVLATGLRSRSGTTRPRRENTVTTWIHDRSAPEYSQPDFSENHRSQISGEGPRRGLGPSGGRRWLAHRDFTRMNIGRIVLGNQIEERLEFSNQRDCLERFSRKRLAPPPRSAEFRTAQPGRTDSDSHGLG